MTDSKRRNNRPARKLSRPSVALDAIPERGLKIGEAARALGVEPYVLRFWETQFPVLKPKHSRSRHRFYHARDIQTLQVIKRLLHGEGFTIAGANKYLREHGVEAAIPDSNTAAKSAVTSEPRPSKAIDHQPDEQMRQVLTEVRRDLESLHKLLAE